MMSKTMTFEERCMEALAAGRARAGLMRGCCPQCGERLGRCYDPAECERKAARDNDDPPFRRSRHDEE